MKKTVILGVGNILREDEGVGVHIIRKLEKSETEIVDGGTLGIDLIPYVENVDKLIIIDALKDGGKPGTIYRLKIKDTPSHISPFTSHLSLHQIDLIDTLKIMEIQNKLPKEIIIIGIEPKKLGWGEELSGEVRGKIPEIINLIHKEIAIENILKGG